MTGPHGRRHAPHGRLERARRIGRADAAAAGDSSRRRAHAPAQRPARGDAAAATGYATLATRRPGRFWPSVAAGVADRTIAAFLGHRARATGSARPPAQSRLRHNRGDSAARRAGICRARRQLRGPGRLAVRATPQHPGRTTPDGDEAAHADGDPATHADSFAAADGNAATDPNGDPGAFAFAVPISYADLVANCGAVPHTGSIAHTTAGALADPPVYSHAAVQPDRTPWSHARLITQRGAAGVTLPGR